MRVYKEGELTVIDFEGATIKAPEGSNQIGVILEELTENKILYQNVVFYGFDIGMQASNKALNSEIYQKLYSNINMRISIRGFLPHIDTDNKEVNQQ